jgi:hypothetical protein
VPLAIPAIVKLTPRKRRMLQSEVQPEDTKALERTRRRWLLEQLRPPGR